MTRDRDVAAPAVGLVAPPPAAPAGRPGAADRAPGAGPRMATPAQSLLAGADRRCPQRGARVSHERGGHAAWRCAPRPHFARLRGECRVPRPPRPRHAGRPALRAERRLRGGDAGRAHPCRGPGGGCGAAARAALAARSSCGTRAACGSDWSVVLLAWARRVAAAAAAAPRGDGSPGGRRAAAPASIVAVALYAFAAWHFLRLYWYRGRPLLLAIVVAVILLAEAMITVAFSRDWHLSWWEWHLLMALGFGAVALGARVEYRREGSLTGAFGGLYLSSTLDRLDRWHADALSDLATASAEGRSSDAVLRAPADGRRHDRGAGAARAGRRRAPSGGRAPPRLPAAAIRGAGADRSGPGPRRKRRGARGHRPLRRPDRVHVLQRAPRADRGGRAVEFGVDGIGPDHHRRGRPDRELHRRWTARDLQRRRRPTRPRAPGGPRRRRHPRGGRRGRRRPPGPTPRFHIGINTGPAFVGTVGAAGRRSFSAIGDTTNLGSRLQGAAGRARSSSARRPGPSSARWRRARHCHPSASRASASRSEPGASRRPRRRDQRTPSCTG